jgi:hypothetical protein
LFLNHKEISPVLFLNHEKKAGPLFAGNGSECMRLARFVLDGRQGIAALDGDTACGRFADEAAYPGELDALLAEGPDILRAAGEALYAGTRIDLSMAQLLSPLLRRRR